MLFLTRKSLSPHNALSQISLSLRPPYVEVSVGMKHSFGKRQRRPRLLAAFLFPLGSSCLARGTLAPPLSNVPRTASLCHAVHAVPQYLSRRTRGTTTSAESVRYRLGQVSNQKTNNPPKYPLPPLHLAGPGTTGKVPPEASRQRERYGYRQVPCPLMLRRDRQLVSRYTKPRTTGKLLVRRPVSPRARCSFSDPLMLAGEG